MIVSRLWLALGFGLAVLPVGMYKFWLLQQGAVATSLGVFAGRVALDNAFYNLAVLDTASAFSANPLLLATGVAVLAASVAAASATSAFPPPLSSKCVTPACTTTAVPAS